MGNHLYSQPLPRMFDLVEQGDLKSIKEAAQDPALKSMLMSDNCALLKFAATHGQVECVRFFCQLAIDSNESFKVSDCGLKEAFESEQDDVVRTIFEFKKIRDDLTNEKSFSSDWIYQHLKHGQTEWVKLLLDGVNEYKLGPVASLVFKKIVRGGHQATFNTAMGFRLLANRLPCGLLKHSSDDRMVDFLLKCKSVFNLLTVGDLFDAIKHRRYDTFQKLIQLPSMRQHIIDKGAELLNKAIEVRCPQMIYDLLLIPEIYHNIDKMTLRQAVMYDHHELVKYLFDHPNIKKQLKKSAPYLERNSASYNATPSMLSVLYNHKDLMQWAFIWNTPLFGTCMDFNSSSKRKLMTPQYVIQKLKLENNKEYPYPKKLFSMSAFQERMAKEKAQLADRMESLVSNSTVDPIDHLTGQLGHLKLSKTLIFSKSTANPQQHQEYHPLVNVASDRSRPTRDS